jgi:hypothetical protein
VLSVLTTLFALFALAWRFEPTMVVVLFGVLRTSNSQQTTHHNTNLTAVNINLNTTQDTKIKGANLQATNQLNIDTKNLEVQQWWWFCLEY